MAPSQPSWTDPSRRRVWLTLHLDLALVLHLALQRVSELLLELPLLLGAERGIGPAVGQEAGASAAFGVRLGDAAGGAALLDVRLLVFGRPGDEPVAGSHVGVLDGRHFLFGILGLRRAGGNFGFGFQQSKEVENLEKEKKGGQSSAGGEASGYFFFLLSLEGSGC